MNERSVSARSETARLKGALTEAYRILSPYSEKYRVDFDRYFVALQEVASIPGARTKRILDVGSGIALLPLALRLVGFLADGMDFFIFPETGNKMFGQENIEDLRRIWKKEGCAVHKCDMATPLPQELRGTADIVISNATIEHLKDPKMLLVNCFSLLTPGGCLILSTPNAATLLKRIRFFFGKSPNWPIADFFSAGESFTGHWREYTRSELLYMCSAVGFQIVKTETKDVLTPWKKEMNIRKNMRAFIARFARCVPLAQEMHYLLCRKP
jgi:2-polyprenyl-3-methyl-5-hydroxy-6-metoxy-1,4-benzoquinol methylase